jgi:hypothetical protein
MGKLICRAIALSLLFAFGSLSQTPTKPKKLRNCPKNDRSIYWDNCIGSSWSDNGATHYVGEFHSGEFNGKGTLTSANGSFHLNYAYDQRPERWSRSADADRS